MDFGVAGQRDEVRKYLAKFVDQAEAMGVTATAHAALGNAAGRILEDTRSVPDAMIVISSHGRGGFKRVVLGSVADKIIRASHHPVLVLKHA
jgi:nucleotide-binding universal stress UspA family protein